MARLLTRMARMTRWLAYYTHSVGFRLIRGSWLTHACCWLVKRQKKRVTYTSIFLTCIPVLRCIVLPCQARLFRVPYFPIRSSRSTALRYGLPSCNYLAGRGVFGRKREKCFYFYFSRPLPLELYNPRRPPAQYIWKSRWPPLMMRRAVSQVSQAHYRNADVTLACERCSVTYGYLQRLVWDVNGFS